MRRTGQLFAAGAFYLRHGENFLPGGFELSRVSNLYHVEWERQLQTSIANEVTWSLYHNESELFLTQLTSENIRPLDGLRVLVVDDCSENLFLFERLLKRNGAQVAVAEDGEAGLQLAAEQKFDAVLMDIQMPEMDGFTVMERLKEVRYDRPVIAITAYSRSDEIARAGFAAQICKPIDKDLFINTVRAVVSS